MLQIRKRKLRYFGHIKRHEGLEKTIMEGGIPAKRRRGRPRRRWIQDVTDGLNMTAAEEGHLAYDRQRNSGGLLGWQSSAQDKLFDDDDYKR